MANTYTQIHIQFVFTVKFRDCKISESWKNELYKYITGIIQNNGHKLISKGGISDHVHLLVGFKTKQAISSLMQDIKGNSSKWINEKKFLKSRFEWQEGYGAFSYGKSQLKTVIKYIENQELHHKKKTFREEFIEFLNKFEVEYDERYIFKDLI